MTGHETALEAACAAVVLGKDEAGNPVHLSQAEADLAISAYLSTLSPDVSGLVERLREPSTNEPTMHLWSSIRKMLQDGNKGSTPRDVFESILGAIDEERSEAADALASLSLQSAAVEGERDQLRTGIKRLSDEEELCAETTGDDPFSLVYLAAKLAAATERRDAAELALGHEIQIKTDLVASLSTAQEENERLREAVTAGAFYIECFHFASERKNATALVSRMRATLSNPSKEDKTDAE